MEPECDDELAEKMRMDAESWKRALSDALEPTRLPAGSIMQGLVPCPSCTDKIVAEVYGCYDCMNTGVELPENVPERTGSLTDRHIELLKVHACDIAYDRWSNDWEDMRRTDDGLFINQLVYWGYLDLQPTPNGVRVSPTDKGQTYLYDLALEADRKRRKVLILWKCGLQWEMTKARLRDEKKRRWERRYDEVTIF